MKTLTLIALAALLAGCGTLKGAFENRVVCTVDGSELHALSKWGPVSLGYKIADTGARVVCARPKT